MSGAGPSRTVLIAHPSADVYGADLQMLQSISGLTGRGWRVVVAVPDDGPLVERIVAAGGEVRTVDFPVLRRASASPGGLVRLSASVARTHRVLRRTIRETSADVVYANTVTVPWWLLAARTSRTPSLCHVHEAERSDPRAVRTVLTAPLLLADRVILNSQSSLRTAAEAVPRVRRRGHVVHNGVPAPVEPPMDGVPTPGRVRLVVISRLSPRKSCADAIRAIGLLRAAGVPAELDVYGTVFPGYEWYAEELRALINELGLIDSVRLRGYVSPVWAALAEAHVLLAPSSRESFGNVVVEAQLARRPVVAAAGGGHLETVEDGRTGLLVEPGDPAALAAAVRRLVDDPALVASLVETAERQAHERFSVEQYADRLDEVVAALAAGPSRRVTR
ncbi:glycosyltransferase family 4 protein [Luteipulveratus sp. YIM 133132]|uniref:glycosyltransferase family 4 protein n=1 Tax=Luteipulveratus flavus TaxID=3031728 RepID=UPI0023AFD9BE|nr:glycosyltransferase family 4 protein [Luteipulveratus sp. YIM 133132]MDE9364327.1 glycosyltransferase family 4 protein [Luteipulveratus sp. YIM 133132]